MIPAFSDVNLALYFRRSSENTKLITDPFSVGQIFVILAKNTLNAYDGISIQTIPKTSLVRATSQKSLDNFSTS